MNEQISFRILSNQTTMIDIVEFLDQEKIAHSEARPTSGGTKPLNSPLDAEIIKDMTMTITVALGSTAAILACVEKILDKAIVVKKKFIILFGPNSSQIDIENKEDIKKLSKEISDIENGKYK